MGGETRKATRVRTTTRRQWRIEAARRSVRRDRRRTRGRWRSAHARIRFDPTPRRSVAHVLRVGTRGAAAHRWVRTNLGGIRRVEVADAAFDGLRLWTRHGRRWRVAAAERGPMAAATASLYVESALEVRAALPLGGASCAMRGPRYRAVVVGIAARSGSGRRTVGFGRCRAAAAGKQGTREGSDSHQVGRAKRPLVRLAPACHGTPSKQSTYHRGIASIAFSRRRPTDDLERAPLVP